MTMMSVLRFKRFAALAIWRWGNAINIFFAPEATRLKAFWLALGITDLGAFFWRDVMGGMPFYFVSVNFYTVFKLLAPRYGRRAAGVITTTLVVLHFGYLVCLGMRRFGG